MRVSWHILVPGKLEAAAAGGDAGEVPTSGCQLNPLLSLHTPPTPLYPPSSSNWDSDSYQGDLCVYLWELPATPNSRESFLCPPLPLAAHALPVRGAGCCWKVTSPLLPSRRERDGALCTFYLPWMATNGAWGGAIITSTTPDAARDAIAFASVIVVTLILYCLLTRRLFCTGAARRVIVSVITFPEVSVALTPAGEGSPTSVSTGNCWT